MKKLKFSHIIAVTLVSAFAAVAFAGSNYFQSVKAEHGAFATRVGIGTMDPSTDYVLDIVGASRITGVPTIVGAPAITGNPTITGDATLTGNLSHDGSSAQTADTSYSGVQVSTTFSPVGQAFMVIKGTGAVILASTPHIATTTAISGQVITFMGVHASSTVAFGDNDSVAGSLMELGDTSRVLALGDILRVRYYGGKWYEEAFVNN